MKFFRKTWDILSFITLLIWISMISKCDSKTVKKRDLLENISSGIRYAGQMFGVNTAEDVANLVARAFATPTKKSKPNFSSLLQNMFGTKQEQAQQTQSQSEKFKEQENFQNINSPTIPVTLLTSLLKLVGFDSAKIAEMAINIMIVMAQMINKVFVGDTQQQQQQLPDNVENDEFNNDSHQPREILPGSPFDWFLELPITQVSEVVKNISDPDLPEKMIELVREVSGGDQTTGCVQLLICKISPIIWGMQLSLQKKVSNIPGAYKPYYKDFDEESVRRNEETIVDSLYRYLPDKKEFIRNSEQCEKRFLGLCERKCETCASPHEV